MKPLVIYDSVYGNTKKIASAIGNAIAEKGGNVKVLSVDEMAASELKSVDFLVVGAPTHGGRPSPDMKEFIKTLPKGVLDDVKITGFDTRIESKTSGFGIRVLTRVLGYAAERIAKRLAQKGGLQAGRPEGFIVDDREGPLKPGEEVRAKEWISQTIKGINHE